MHLLPLPRLLKKIEFAFERRSHRGSRFSIVYGFLLHRLDEMPTDRFIDAHWIILIAGLSKCLRLK